MSNSKSPTISLELEVPTYLPLSEAADKYNLSEQALTQLIEAGKIEAVRLPSGEVLVSTDNGSKAPQTKEEIIATEFAHLCEQPISASEPSRRYSRKYGITIGNELFSLWSRLGYIKRESGYRLELDEADVAYCAEIYTQNIGNMRDNCEAYAYSMKLVTLINSNILK